MQTPIRHLHEFVGKTVTDFTLAAGAMLVGKVAIHFDETQISIAFRSIIVREVRRPRPNGEIIREYPDGLQASGRCPRYRPGALSEADGPELLAARRGYFYSNLGVRAVARSRIAFLETLAR